MARLRRSALLALPNGGLAAGTDAAVDIWADVAAAKSGAEPTKSLKASLWVYRRGPPVGRPATGSGALATYHLDWISGKIRASEELPRGS